MVEIPRLVAVETTSHCNARCPFCPHGVMARGHGPMDDDLFAKIIEDCRAFPLPAIEPFLVGDPFSDPQILDRLALIRRRLPKTALRLYTNGHALTPQKTDAMRGLRLDHLFISLNTLDPARYEAVMGLRLERTLDNLAYLLDPARRDEVARRVSLRMTRLADTTLAEQDAFLAYCRDKRVRPLIVGLFNYKGDVGSDLPVPRHGCEHTGRLDILADGRVTLCCMDQEGEHGWGSVRDHSVLELYRHREARRYRDAHARGRRREVEPCASCNNFWPGFHGARLGQQLRTAVDYGLYQLRHRPSGRRPPTSGAQAGSLIALRRRRAGE